MCIHMSLMHQTSALEIFKFKTLCLDIFTSQFRAVYDNLTDIQVFRVCERQKIKGKLANKSNDMPGTQEARERFHDLLQNSLKKITTFL